MHLGGAYASYSPNWPMPIPTRLQQLAFGRHLGDGSCCSTAVERYFLLNLASPFFVSLNPFRGIAGPALPG